jgi:hypothetical protein
MCCSRLEMFHFKFSSYGKGGYPEMITIFPDVVIPYYTGAAAEVKKFRNLCLSSFGKNERTGNQRFYSVAFPRRQSSALLQGRVL